ncbi:MAG: nitroreductase family protein [bacterium]
MELYEAIRGRRSIRKYKDKEIEADKLKKVLDTAQLAPSAKNVQPWKIILVEDEEQQNKLVAAAGNQKFIKQAPYIVVVCTSEVQSYQTHGDYMSSFAVDGAIFMDHLTLAAYDEGLGTCWIANFNEEKIRKIMEIPDEYRVVNLSPLGYPAEEGNFAGRKPLSEIVFQNKWGEEFTPLSK